MNGDFSNATRATAQGHAGHGAAGFVSLVAVLAGLASGSPARAALLGNNFEISGPGCRFPDAAYASAARQYLVVWADYNVTRIYGRLVTDTGIVSGAAFPISETPYGALFPAVAYNATNNEFLVTWDDFNGRGEVIHGQRVRASDGALVGANFAVGSIEGGIRSAVAWSPVNNVYLTVYWGPGSSAPEVYGQRVSATGALIGGHLNLSSDAEFSGYPAVAWGASGNQFLVTWDNNDGNIHGRRIDAATGALLGSVIYVTTGGAKDRSCVAYDSVNHRWLVQFNEGGNAGFSYDQSGQFINPDGTLNGGLVPLAHTPAFEGDTQFGGDIAFAPGAQRFFSSFGTDTGMGGQESSVGGAPVGTQVTLGTGYYTSLNNAADPHRSRFLTAWEGLVGGSYRIFGQLFGVTVNPVTHFTAAAQSAQVVLSWRNPTDPHFTGTRIRFRTDGYPAHSDDGMLVADPTGVPGATNSLAHTNLANWTTRYYAAFAHDVGPNYSPVAQAAATPRPPVATVSSSEFTVAAADWVLVAWQAGTSAPGTIAHDAAAGNIVSTGGGVSNNRDTCTREGGFMTKSISTAGRQSLQVEYDVMATLHAPPTGSSGGSCAVLDGSSEDKLVLYYSTAGTNGPWTMAETLHEGIDLPTGWTRRLVNLAGIAAVNDNPAFAVRFQWQFNHANDTGRVDNIRVLSGAVTAPSPAIGLSATLLERTVQLGQNPPNDLVHVSNTGEGILNFSLSDNAPWLTVSPAGASSPGPPRTVTIAYNASALPVGDYEAGIQVASPDAGDSPRTLTVKLRVIPPACFWEPFGYYGGSLTIMGGVSWSGSATNQLLVDAGTLRIVGGGGAVSATHSVSCAGSNGLIAVQTKIRKGAGSGDFFWNIAVDDSSGNNLARWYGGSTVARGRVGGNVTADMALSGPGTWDDLYIVIDTTANTSTFFFNGVSFGSIAHGSAPMNTVGTLRLERLDRLSASGDDIRFDNLSVGAVNTSPPRLQFSRGDNTLVLTWPAAGRGARLESTPGLIPPIQWSPRTNALILTNGQHQFTCTLTERSLFLRLREP